MLDKDGERSGDQDLSRMRGCCDNDQRILRRSKGVLAMVKAPVSVAHEMPRSVWLNSALQGSKQHIKYCYETEYVKASSLHQLEESIARKDAVILAQREAISRYKKDRPKTLTFLKKVIFMYRDMGKVIIDHHIMNELDDAVSLELDKFLKDRDEKPTS